MIGGGHGDHEDGDHDSILPRLGEGIPYGASSGWDESNGGGNGTAGGGLNPPQVDGNSTGQAGHRASSSPSSAETRGWGPLEASNTATAPEKASFTIGGASTGGGTADTSTGIRRRGKRSPTRGAARPWTAVERAKRAPLRFFLVREGNKFVAVGRTLTKGAWRELPEVLASTSVPASSYGIPVVLDPSPYQVSCALRFNFALRFKKNRHAVVVNRYAIVAYHCGCTPGVVAFFVPKFRRIVEGRR